MSANLLAIVQAERQADELVENAKLRHEEALSDALKERELRLKGIETPKVRLQKISAPPANLSYLRTIASRNREKAIRLILEAFDAQT